jgi:hypothetical protein
VLRLPILALLYAGIFHFLYISYLTVEFQYAAFYYFPPTFFELAVAYALAVVPVIGYRSSGAISSYGAEIIYAICYVPAPLIILFNWQGGEAGIFLVLFSLGLSMWCILRAAAWGDDASIVTVVPGRSQHLEGAGTILVYGLTLVGLLALIVSYGQYMQFVGLEEIYDQRFVANQTSKGLLSDYFSVLLPSAFLPFFYARALVRRSLVDLSLGLVLSVLIYMAVGSKAAVLMGPAVLLLYLVYGNGTVDGNGTHFLARLLALICVALFLTLFISADDYFLSFFKSLLLVRTIAVGGWTMSAYYEFFSNNSFTYYTHIGPIGALTAAYPYGSLPIGRVVGLHYIGTEEVNINANFWASDGFAALGVGGIPIATIALCGVFFWLNKLSRAFDKRFLVLWLCGFWQVLLNAPLTTSLLSGGGLIIMGVLWWDSVLRRGANSIVGSSGNGSDVETAIR